MARRLVVVFALLAPSSLGLNRPFRKPTRNAVLPLRMRTDVSDLYGPPPSAETVRTGQSAGAEAATPAPLASNTSAFYLNAPPPAAQSMLSEEAKAQIVADHKQLLDQIRQNTDEPPASAQRFSSSLFSFAASVREDALDRWERVDDVIMGGVSSSVLLSAPPGEDGVNFQGVLRSEGGGFCGQRTKKFTQALDLSAFQGLFIRCQGDAFSNDRVYKVSMRTKDDTSEVVYSAEFRPPADYVGTVLVPFSDFKLVRGPRLVPNAPPMNASAVYQLSTLCTKFRIAANTTVLDGFRAGAFKLRFEEIGVYGALSPQAVKLPAPETPAQTAAARPLVVKTMGPLFKLVFNEQARRRRLAAEKLRKRGKIAGPVKQARFAWRRQVAAKGVFAAPAALAANAAQELVALLLTVPFKLLFRAISFGEKLFKRAKAVLAPSKESQLRLPALT